MAQDKEEARFGQADSQPAEHGRIVVLHHDEEGPDGEIYKAGVHDLPVEVADALIDEGKAFEPEGKKKGR